MHILGLVVVVVVVVVGAFVVVVDVVVVVVVVVVDTTSLLGSVVQITTLTSGELSLKSLYTATPEKMKRRSQIAIRKQVLRIVN